MQNDCTPEQSICSCTSTSFSTKIKHCESLNRLDLFVATADSFSPFPVKNIYVLRKAFSDIINQNLFHICT